MSTDTLTLTEDQVALPPLWEGLGKGILAALVCIFVGWLGGLFIAVLNLPDDWDQPKAFVSLRFWTTLQNVKLPEQQVPMANIVIPTIDTRAVNAAQLVSLVQGMALHMEDGPQMCAITRRIYPKLNCMEDDGNIYFQPHGFDSSKSNMGVLTRGGYNHCRPVATVRKHYAQAGIPANIAEPLVQTFGGKCGVEAMQALANASHATKNAITLEQAATLALVELQEGWRTIISAARQHKVTVDPRIFGEEVTLTKRAVLNPTTLMAMVDFYYLCPACVAPDAEVWTLLKNVQRATDELDEQEAIAAVLYKTGCDWKWSRDGYHNPRALFGTLLLAQGLGLQTDGLARTGLCHHATRHLVNMNRKVNVITNVVNAYVGKPRELLHPQLPEAAFAKLF